MPRDVLDQEILPGAKILWASRGGRAGFSAVMIVEKVSEKRVTARVEGAPRTSVLHPETVIVVDPILAARAKAQGAA